MSARTEALRDAVFAVDPAICADRARLLTESWRETAGQPTIVRRALGLARILEGLSIYIRPGELIVGNNSSQPRAAPVFPEFAVGWIAEELDELPRRPIDRFVVGETTRQTLLEVCEFWRGQTFQDRVTSATRLGLPPELSSAFDFRLSSMNQAVSNLSHLSTGDGHIVPGYERVLTNGLDGLITEARRNLDSLDLTRAESVERRLFYQAVIIVLEAAISFANRYARLADVMAASATDALRRAELTEIAEVCRRVPARPARSFREALQACWFAHLLVQTESNGHSISLGRFDQFLYPYYASELAAGRITREQALELLECFWIKCNELNKVREWAYTEFMSGYPMFQTLTLGGQTSEGTDATNDLTYLCLEATANLRLPQPTTVLRVHDGSPEECLLAAAECLVRHRGGMPGFFSDEVATPLLMRLGVSLDDARDWSVMGCCEPQVGGRFLPGTSGMSHINLLKVLEIALHGGANPTNGLAPFVGDGDLRSFGGFESVWEAFRYQLGLYLAVIPLLDNVTAQAYADLVPTPFLSTLVDHSLALGRDVSVGGPPNHRNLVLHAYGLANVANSLAALKRLVFEERALSADEVADALAGDFAGPRGEEIRQMLLNRAPKYGNDDDEADRLAQRVVNEMTRQIDRYRPLRGGNWGISTQSLTANVPAGARIGATPDGRKAREPLADNNSPTAGSDANGPTAVLKSVAKLDHARLSNGTILNIKFHPSALAGESRRRKFTSLVRTFIDLKGFQVQFNVIAAETLKAAQAHPEDYRSLVVKVAGYSALFSTLDRRLQDQLIARTEHELR